MQSHQSGKLREKSILSRRLKVYRELDERTSGDRVFQTRSAAIEEARSRVLWKEMLHVIQTVARMQTLCETAPHTPRPPTATTTTPTDSMMYAAEKMKLNSLSTSRN